MVISWPWEEMAAWESASSSSEGSGGLICGRLVSMVLREGGRLAAQQYIRQSERGLVGVAQDVCGPRERGT